MDDQRQSPESPGEQPSDASNGERDVRDMRDMRDMRDADAVAAMTPDMEAELPEAGAVPPGYDWPTHGGYLGCLLGLMPACLVAGFLSSTFVAWPWFNGKSDLSPFVSIVLIVALFVVCVYGFGRIGWVLGRRYYRKYPRTEPTWGEDEGTADVDVVDAANAAHTSLGETPMTGKTAPEESTHQAMQ